MLEPRVNGAMLTPRSVCPSSSSFSSLQVRNTDERLHLLAQVNLFLIMLAGQVRAAHCRQGIALWFPLVCVPIAAAVPAIILALSCLVCYGVARFASAAFSSSRTRSDISFGAVVQVFLAGETLDTKSDILMSFFLILVTVRSNLTGNCT